MKLSPSRKRLLIGIFCVLLFSAWSSAALAAYQLPNLSITLPNFKFRSIIQAAHQISVPFLADYIFAVYKYAVGLGVVTAAVVFVYGGFLYIVGGTTGQVVKGKQKILDAVVGLVILLSSYTILNLLNPLTTSLKPLTIQKIDPIYMAFADYGDATPENLDTTKPKGAVKTVGEIVQDMKIPVASSTQGGAPGSGEGSQPAPAPAEPPGAVPRDGVTDSFGNKLCSPNPPYKTGNPGCTSADDCFSKYCNSDGTPKADPPIPEGIGDPKKMETFKELPGGDNPKRIDLCRAGGSYTKEMALGIKRQSVEQYGIWFNCMQPAGIYLRPEAKAALLKVGKYAASKGYFLRVVDAYRSMAAMNAAFCKRRYDAKQSGQAGAGGLALPGGSPHQIGIAVDVLLYKWDPSTQKEKQISAGPPVCSGSVNMVDSAVAMGLDKQKLLEDIMAYGGFRRMCAETWHFNYLGAYKSDCYECIFPPAPKKSELNNCQVKYKP